MDIDTDWCLNCGKQTNGGLYCSSQCKSQDEKGCKHGSNPTSNFGTYNDDESIHSGKHSPFMMNSYNSSSKYLNNPDKLLYYQSYDLKFRNRPSYEAGFYSPCLSSGLNQWLTQNVKMMTPSLEQNKNSYMKENDRYNKSNIKFNSGFKGSFSSTSSESSYSSYSDTLTLGSSTSSNSFSMNEPFYPWNKIDDDDISLYEY